MEIARNSPNDTRYSFAALVAGVIIGVGLAGALFLAGLASPLAGAAGAAVRDAERTALEVQNYDEAVILSAQTALRDAIGKHDLAELIQSRVELGHGLKVALEQKMQTWGIEVQSVEIRDVIIPHALEHAMS